MRPSFHPLSLSPSGRFVVALAGLLTTALCLHMMPEWLHNPDLSHGLFAPVLFLLLLNESRRRGPWRYIADSAVLRGLRGVVLAAGVGLVCIAGLYAAAVEWRHPLVGLSLALALSALLLAALLWLSTTRVRALPLNWTSFVAVGFWPLCAPIPPGTYSRLTLQLQFWVTDIVLEALHLLGVAATTSGNIIQLAHTSVGVEEACSGVRSLLSCFVAALFFSATLVRNPRARILLIALAPPLAFGMNILRSLGLTLLANAGVDIGGQWHDLTGFAVLGVTAIILGGIAVWLEEPAPASPQAASVTATEAASPPRGILAGYTLAAVLVGFFVLNTHGPTRKAGPAPDLQAILPPAPEGWELVRTTDLYRFAAILETETLLERTYIRHRYTDKGDRPLQITVYLAYWSPGQAPVSSVSAHTPEACWPAGGWTAQPGAPAPAIYVADGRALPPPEYRAFTHSGLLQNVWYWHLYDGRSITQTDPRSAGALLKLAWNYGFRSAGEQMFVRVSSNRPWNEICDDPLLTGILARLQPFGL
ncbi:MAG TPA: exosortase/archaeosortase family protein [Rariglobus sp.]